MNLQQIRILTMTGYANTYLLSHWKPLPLRMSRKDPNGFGLICLALYIISLTTCSLLYFEYKSITNLCLGHVTGLPPKPSQFTILVRGIPWSSEDSYCEAVKKFFTYYHPTTSLSHQIVYKCGAVEKIKDDAEYICKMLGDGVEHSCKPSIVQCYFCGGTNSFKIIANETDSIHSRTCILNLQEKTV